MHNFNYYDKKFNLIMQLEEIDIIAGILNIAFIGFSCLIGGKIAYRYREHKNKNLLYVGFSWILLCSGWYGTTVSFIVALATAGEGISFEVIMLINFIPFPFGVILWLVAFTNFLYKKRQKEILLSLTVLFLTFEISLIYLLAIPGAIGEKISPVDTRTWNPFMNIFLIIIIVIILVSGFLFSLETLKIDDPETKLKGRLIFIAFPLFATGGYLDASQPLSYPLLIITRIILFSSAFFFYSGFILPEWIKNLFLKERGQ